MKLGRKKTGKFIKCFCGTRRYLAPSVIKMGAKFCSHSCSGMAHRGRRVIFTKEHKEKISKNHHNVIGDNNPNWKGGITNEQTKYRNKHWKEFINWRESVLKRDGYKCKNCQSKNELHAHHIIARKTLQSAEFIVANGVSLCKKCHRDTDSWGGGNDRIKYNRMGRIVGFIIKIIPHNWQDYKTVGNYFFTKDGYICIFCSDTGNDKYNLSIIAHEMIESSLVLDRCIPIKNIDQFDKMFEKERETGLWKYEEPGHDKRAPYGKEHKFAEKIERIVAKEIGVNWSEYDKIISEL